MNISPNERKSEIEKGLLPRLKFLGYLLCIFGLFSLCYAFFSSSAPMDRDSAFDALRAKESFSGVAFEQETLPFVLTKGERSRLYGIAAIFAVVGTMCVITARRKQKT